MKKQTSKNKVKTTKAENNQPKEEGNTLTLQIEDGIEIPKMTRNCTSKYQALYNMEVGQSCQLPVSKRKSVNGVLHKIKKSQNKAFKTRAMSAEMFRVWRTS